MKLRTIMHARSFLPDGRVNKGEDGLQIIGAKTVVITRVVLVITRLHAFPFTKQYTIQYMMTWNIPVEKHERSHLTEEDILCLPWFITEYYYRGAVSRVHLKTADKSVRFPQ